jgi:hypothetical protein
MMPFQGNPMPGQAPMGQPMPVAPMGAGGPMRNLMRAAALRGGPQPQMPMPQGPVAQSQSLPPPPQMPMPRQPLPGPMGPIGQSNSAMPNPPSPVSGMMGGVFPPQLPGPIAQSSQNLWAGPQSY